MCDCKNVGEKWFKSNRLQSKEDVENNEFKKSMLCVDCAGVKNKNKNKADYFAFVVGSLATNDFKYIRTGELLKFNEFDEYIKHVIDLLLEFSQITCIYIEKNTYSGLDVDRIQKEINKHPLLSKRNITIINEMQRKNKDMKIETVIDPINNGRIIFCKERVMKEAINQMMEFCGQHITPHDDFIDTIAEFSNRIDEIEVLQYATAGDRRKIGL